MTLSQGSGLSILLKSLGELERFTVVNMGFFSYADIAIILEAFDRLKMSKSLAKFSLTFERCQLAPSNRLYELFLTLKEIKSLKSSEISFKECSVPGSERLKTLVPYIEEIGHNGNISKIFENCHHAMTRYQRVLFINSVQDVKSSHKIQAQIDQLTTSHSLKLFESRFISYFC